DRERRVHGVVAECDLLDALPDDRFHYRVVLVPRLWLLSLSRQNQIYQKLSIPDIVSQEIVASSAKGITKDAASGLAGDDFEMRLTRAYPQREYTVQFRESDLDFISRLMEHEGIFYFFEQLEDREKMVLSDNNVHFAALEEDDTLAYRPASGMARAEDEAVLSFAVKHRRVPRKMVIKDYNYRMPHLTLQGEALIDKKAHGICSDYGDHFKSPEEGDEMARIRAQELLCGKSTYRGHADSIRLWPGWRFSLDDHFRESFNAGYIVTAISHSGRQPLESAAGIDGTQSDASTYDNHFTCIPSGVDYRPPRRTPKPVIQGLMNAHVDAALLEKRAEIDEQGRYKLVMPFDLSGAAAGKASRFVRKAQPYGGQDMGMHFPLYKGTEVICGFVNGDPDRPIITGVVPNPLTASVVTSDNYTKNVVKTGHGSYLEFNDGKGPADRAVEAASNDGGLAAQQQHQSTAPAPEGLPISDAGPAATVKTGPGGRREVELARQQHRQNLSSAQESAPGSSADVWFRVDVPNYNSKTAQDEQKSAYLRMGERPPDERYTMDAKSEEKKETYAVETSGRTVSISCKEGNRYIVSPNPGTGIKAPGYSISSCMSGMSFDPATGVITFNVGFGAFEGQPQPANDLDNHLHRQFRSGPVHGNHHHVEYRGCFRQSADPGRLVRFY
ncbi:MAG: type VI secretion system tip protein TssI/VgrG, partial [Desulfosarcinaceae bacterium]